MTAQNPYAPPRNDDLSSRSGDLTRGAWRVSGRTLIADKGASLPDLCLFSGEPTQEGRTRRTLMWTPRWFVVLAVMSPMIGVIAYWFTRRSGELEFTLSPAARKRRRGGFWIVIYAFIAMILVIFLGMKLKLAEFAPLAIVLFFVGFVIGLTRARLFQITHIDKLQIRIKLKPAAAEAFARQHKAARAADA